MGKEWADLPTNLCEFLTLARWQTHGFQTQNHTYMYSGTSVYNRNLFFNLGTDGSVCICVWKMAEVLFVTRCRICKQKWNCAKCFGWIEFSANKSIHEPRYYCIFLDFDIFSFVCVNCILEIKSAVCIN